MFDEFETKTEIATVSTQATNLVNFSESMKEAGFDGLELTGMSIDRIKLHEGTFKFGMEEADIGNSFDCIIQSTKRLFVIRQFEGQDAETYYSYDRNGSTKTDGSSAEDILNSWADEGYAKPDVKEYLEAVAILTNRDDDLEGQIVMLSIPPASRSKLAPVAMNGYQKYGKLLNQLVVRASVGKTVGEGSKKYRPWVFSLVGVAQ